MPVGEKIGIYCEMGATWSSGVPWSVSVLVLCSCHLNQQPYHYTVFQACSCWRWELLKWAPFPAGCLLWLLWKKQTSRKFVHIVVKSRECSWGKAGGSEWNWVPLPSQGSCWIWWLLLVLLLAPASSGDESLHPELPLILGRSFNNHNKF